MKKEFIVARIEALSDGSPYVFVTFNDPKDYKSGERPQNPMGPNAMAFTSIEDLMKNMPKVMASITGGAAGGMTENPTVKLSMREYQDMGIKVGDRVTIEIQKVEASGI